MKIKVSGLNIELKGKAEQKLMLSLLGHFVFVVEDDEARGVKTGYATEVKLANRIKDAMVKILKQVT